ncbi:MAG: type II toxin-antitoxin system HicB family antitoxin [Deltaproteobacteria bacterium]|jgi:hypothetical protein|nr:type II toxin-antitoxin system HicB family antitoxin [Deltaproteobacteria bacterium]
MNELINKLERKEKNLYVTAYREGYSVLVIGRLLGFDNMGRVYRVLREANAVAKLPKGQRPSLPVRLEATFCKIKLSFAQWCNSWDFEVKTAERAIKLGHWDAKLPEHREVLDGLKYDFHNLYMQLYEIGNEFDRKNPADRGPGPKHTLLIEWDDDEGGYIASIPELPDIVAYGATWDAALAELKYFYNVKRRIQKLEDLIGG